MNKTLAGFILIIIFIVPAYLWADPYVKCTSFRTIVYSYNPSKIANFLLVIKLYNGLTDKDINRFKFVERGIPVSITIKCKLFRKRIAILPDENVIIDENKKKPIKELIITRKLLYQRVGTHKYTITQIQNYNDIEKTWGFYRPSSWKKAFVSVRDEFFNKEFKLYINSNRFDLEENEEYYFEIFVEFRAYQGPTPIIDPYNFSTDKCTTKVFKW